MKYRLITILVLTLLVSLGFATAVVEDAAISTDAGERSSGTITTSQNATGANVTSENVSGTAVTTRWTGFYGNLSGNVVLGDSSQSTFRAWKVHTFQGGVVYAANGSVSDWSSSSIQPATVSDMPTYLTTAATDNFTNTFTGMDTFSSASLSVESTYYALTRNSTGENHFYTYALKSTTDNTLLFAGAAEDDMESFSGSTVDYQLIAPARDNTTYEFYLELP